METARRKGNSLVRFNLSSRVTIDDLLGRIVITNNGGSDQLGFMPQPFTVAFRDGKWLLLDELNLAPDNVLQCIERAIDTQTLTIHNAASASDYVMTVHMHPKFRLFATQNPNSGFFKGATARRFLMVDTMQSEMGPCRSKKCCTSSMWPRS